MNSENAKILYNYIASLGHKAELVLNESFMEKGVCPNIVFVTPIELQKLDIPEEELNIGTDIFYDGMDTHYEDHKPERVHVFDKSKLRAFAYGSWADKQKAIADTANKREIGG